MDRTRRLARRQMDAALAMGQKWVAEAMALDAAGRLLSEADRERVQAAAAALADVRRGLCRRRPLDSGQPPIRL